MKNHIMMPMFFRGFFDFFGRGKFTAITVSKNTAWYLTFNALGTQGLRRHEEAHMEQYKRYTWVGFVILYLLYSLRYGYYNNPLEVEAREKSHYGYKTW